MGRARFALERFPCRFVAIRLRDVKGEVKFELKNSRHVLFRANQERRMKVDWGCKENINDPAKVLQQGGGATSKVSMLRVTFAAEPNELTKLSDFATR